MTTYDEWRITGTPDETSGPYEFTWSPKRGDEFPEDKARRFIQAIRRSDDPWTDGPHLHRRTVIVTSWRDVPPPGRHWGEHPAHPTCIDVTGTDQTPHSVWTCGPDCPKEA